MAKKETGLRYEPLYKPRVQHHQQKAGEKRLRGRFATLVRRVLSGLRKDRHR